MCDDSSTLFCIEYNIYGYQQIVKCDIIKRRIVLIICEIRSKQLIMAFLIFHYFSLGRYLRLASRSQSVDDTA